MLLYNIPTSKTKYKYKFFFKYRTSPTDSYLLKGKSFWSYISILNRRLQRENRYCHIRRWRWWQVTRTVTCPGSWRPSFLTGQQLPSGLFLGKPLKRNWQALCVPRLLKGPPLYWGVPPETPREFQHYSSIERSRTRHLQTTRSTGHLRTDARRYSLAMRPWPRATIRVFIWTGNNGKGSLQSTRAVGKRDNGRRRSQ